MGILEENMWKCYHNFAIMTLIMTSWEMGDSQEDASSTYYCHELEGKVSEELKNFHKILRRLKYKTSAHKQFEYT